MIKKIIACLTICFIITGIISPVFSDASALPQPNWSDPGISEIINISDLTGWMLNGGTFDVSQYTDSESFMNDYFNARTQTRLISPGEDAEDYYEVFPGFGINNQLVPGDIFARPLDTNRVIASSFRDHTGYGRRLSNEVNDALLSSGSLYDTKIPLLNEVEFANFVGYNHDALRLYSEFFNNEPNVPQPNPDPAYLSYIQKMNGHGDRQFTWYNMSSNVGGISVSAYPATDYTWYSHPAGYGSLQDISFGGNGRSANFISCTNLTTLNITSSDNIYTGSIILNDILFTNSYYNCSFDMALGGNNEYFVSRIYEKSNVKLFNNQTFTYTGSLTNVLNYFSNKIRNVNIYVDGKLWALVNEPVLPPSITPEFPDAIGGEDLPNTTWPISRPRAPYYTSVPGMLKAIEDAIEDDGKLDIDDLKPYLTDENGDPVPDPQFDHEPVPIPLPDPVNPDIIPGLPVLPAMPPEMPGFSGVSVLAEIINFTNQSLPTSLIITFWGIVFGLVILGLIKILHK